MTEPEEGDPRLVPYGAAFVYALLLLGSLAWLALADRMAELPRAAIGTHGPLVDLAVGVGAGLLCAAVAAILSRVFAPIRRCEGRLAAMLGQPSELACALLVFAAAAAEQIAFRVVVQGAFGPVVAVAAQAAAGTGPGFWAFWPLALSLAVTTTLLVHVGFGLAAAAVAHALTLHLTLRRILFQ